MDFENDIRECMKVLASGGLILYPTDTIWGIGCDATNSEAVAKIYRLKNRPDEKSMIILVAGEKDILQHVAAPDMAVFDFLQTRSKPTTVIYAGALGLADNLLASDGSVAIRICKDEFVKHLIKRFRKPIVSTSANLSGQPPPDTFKNISQIIREGVDYVVQWRRDDKNPAVPSSIIKWVNGQAEFIRS